LHTKYFRRDGNTEIKLLKFNRPFILQMIQPGDLENNHEPHSTTAVASCRLRQGRELRRRLKVPSGGESHDESRSMDLIRSSSGRMAVSYKICADLIGNCVLQSKHVVAVHLQSPGSISRLSKNLPFPQSVSKNLPPLPRVSKIHRFAEVARYDEFCTGSSPETSRKNQ
jgi:hypothetical protein